MMSGVVGDSVATVATGSVVHEDNEMSIDYVSVLAYRAKARPNLKWQVRARHPGTKKVSRWFFETKLQAETEAQAKRRDFRAGGQEALNIDRETLLQAIEAKRILEPFSGVSIVKLAQEYSERNHRWTATLGGLVQEFLVSRAKLGATKRYVSNVRKVCGAFVRKLGPTRQVWAITPEEVCKYLDGLSVSGVSANSYRTYLSVLFNFAERKAMIKENPVDKVERRKEVKKAICILSPNDMMVLLVSAQSLEEWDILLAIALGGFAGLRPEEVKRLSYKTLCDGYIKDSLMLGAEMTKTASQRFVAVHPTLSRFIEIVAHKGFLTKSGDCVPNPNFRKRFESVIAKAGVKWGHDILRHSFGTYHYAMWQDAAKTAFEMGHSNTTMLFRHYRSRVTKEQAEAWWSITL